MSSIDLNDIVDESYYRNRGRKTPILDVLKKTKNRKKSGKSNAGKLADKDKEKHETENPGQLQIDSIDTIELNNMLNDDHQKNGVKRGKTNKEKQPRKKKPEPKDTSKIQINSVSSIDYNDNLGDAHSKNCDLMRPVHLPKKSQKQVKSIEEQK